VKRKGKRLTRQQAGAPAPQKAGTVSLLPMEIQIGDRFTDGDFEWQVITRPETLHGGKTLRARVQREGLPESEREVAWPAYVRVEIRRADGPTQPQ
jgi:hypothetical protein